MVSESAWGATEYTDTVKRMTTLVDRSDQRLTHGLCKEATSTPRRSG